MMCSMFSEQPGCTIQLLNIVFTTLFTLDLTIKALKDNSQVDSSKIVIKQQQNITNTLIMSLQNFKELLCQ